jgi:sialic acid synthase SpsE
MLLKNTQEIYFIAEVGQNHNGDMDIAKKLIDQLNQYPYDEISGNRLNKVNAIKLTKRDLDEELSKEGMMAPYTGAHSFGKTYGEHREFLELSYEQHAELGKYIKSLGFDFIETLCSIKTLKLLDIAPIDKIKVASRDLTNIPLIEAIAQTNLPVILSTGMAGEKELNDALEIFYKYNTPQVDILHCLSQYPAEFNRVNLNTIKYLKDNYPNHNIGYSDHTLGIHVPLAAVALGAQIIEKHVTLDKNMKGTDQKGSSEPHEVKQLLHDIRTFEMSLGNYELAKDPSTNDSSKKLERSLATKRFIKQGEILTQNDIHMISPGNGFKWNDINLFLGKSALKDIDSNTILTQDLV